MEKNTLLAVLLSVVVLVGFYFVQGMFFPPPAPVSAPAAQTAPEQAAPVQAQSAPQAAGVSAVTPPAASAVQQPAQSALPPPQAEERITIETDLIRVVLSSAGGDVVSWKLKEHDDKDDLVEMVLSGSKEGHAFTVSFDSIENMLDGRGSPVSTYFHVNRVSDYSVEFSSDFVIPAGAGGEGGVFKLIKRYDFKPGEYMFELNISMDGGYSTKGFNFNGAAYTLAFGPQIGPRFEKLDQKSGSEFRQYLTYTNNKVKQGKTGVVSKEMPAWAAIAGKYFTVIAVPYAPQFRLAFSGAAEEGLSAASRLLISRADYSGSRLDDRYLFYVGPKNTDTLGAYYNGKNNFNVRGLQIADAAKTRSFLSIPPLEKALKWLLLIFYKLIPNYGVAIILLTLLVKVVFFPLTKKSSEATLRMQTLSPKIKELQTKYKDNPQKMNAEMGELYRKEGYNPLSGCLPMLLQIPIFFAMYNLFNNHFDLRGAMFIPGWIPDLSLPESIWTFPDGVRLPLLGWTALRALPFVYVGSQLLYGKFTQTPDQQGNAQMKMMLYVMPIVFFFVLYDVPSGLLIYWIFSNVLTLVQQIILTKYRKAPQGALDNPAPVIAPKKKKRR